MQQGIMTNGPKGSATIFERITIPELDSGNSAEIVLLFQCDDAQPQINGQVWTCPWHMWESVVDPRGERP